MKILINAVAAKSGGAATYTVNLAEQLATIVAPHRYVFYVPRALAKAIRGTSVQVAAVETTVGSASFLRRFLWDQVVLRKLVKKNKVDILISSSDFGMLFPPCRQVLLLRNSLFFSPFYLQTILPRQSWRSKGEFLLRRWLVLLSARSSDLVVMASRTMLADVQRFIRLPRDRAVVNYFGVPLERFVMRRSTSSQVAEREESNSPFRLLHVSTYSDYKNLTTLLKAVRILAEQGTCEVSLVTTADPWQFPEVEVVSREEDQALAAHQQVTPFVKFTGPIPYDDVPHLYREADLFVFPSLAESFGHPLVEAMASGLPILASDIPICREISGNAALYFSPHNANDLAENILRLRRDPHQRQQLGDAGRKRAELCFDWKEHVRRLVGLIEQVGAHA